MRAADELGAGAETLGRSVRSKSMTRRLALLALTALTVAGSAPAARAAGWSDPSQLDTTATFAQSFSPDAGTLYSRDFSRLWATPRTGASFGAPTKIFEAVPSESLFYVGSDEHNALTILTLRRHKPYNRVRISLRAPDGTLTPSRTISGKGRSASQPALAVAPDGTAVAGWNWHDPAGWRVQVAIRRPGQATFDAPQFVGDPGRDPKIRPWVDVAAANGGHAVVAWHFGGGYQHPSESLNAATANADGTFGAPIVLDQGAGFYETGLAVAADGRAIVAWQPTYYLARGDTELAVLKLAEAAPGASFGATTQLTRGGPGFLDQGNPVVSLQPGGAAVIAWGEPMAAGHTNGVVEVFSRPTAGDFGPGYALSDGARSPSGLTLSAGADGTVALGWADSHFASGYHGPNWESHVSVRAPGRQQFPQAARVTDPAHNGLWPVAAVAVDGSVAAAWVVNDDGSGGGSTGAAVFQR